MFKIKMTKTIRSFLSFENWNFEFVSDFDIRISDLEGYELC